MIESKADNITVITQPLVMHNPKTNVYTLKVIFLSHIGVC